MKLFLLKEENILLKEVQCTPINTTFGLTSKSPQTLCWPSSAGSQDLTGLDLTPLSFYLSLMSVQWPSGHCWTHWSCSSLNPVTGQGLRLSEILNVMNSRMLHPRRLRKVIMHLPGFSWEATRRKHAGTLQCINTDLTCQFKTPFSEDFERINSYQK